MASLSRDNSRKNLASLRMGGKSGSVLSGHVFKEKKKIRKDESDCRNPWLEKLLVWNLLESFPDQAAGCFVHFHSAVT